MKYFLVLFSVICLATLAQAQEKTFSVIGKVVDSSSRLPLSGASVFAQNTTQGTTSNSEGKFFIRLPNGGYDLVISYTGYDKKIFRISHTQVLTDTMIIELIQQDRAMTEVAVVASNEVADGWEKFGKFFSDNFIGTTPNAAKTLIQNPEALRFFYTKNNKRHRLTVKSKEDLVILNHSLGYKIRYQLDSFNYDYNSNISQYTGYPLFEEIDTTQEVKSTWVKNRARTYLGSRMHFMHSFFDSVLTEEGFVVEKLDDKNLRNIEGAVIANVYDSTYYFKDSSMADINWKGRYRISYKSVLPDKKFIEEFKLPANARAQVTLLDIADGFVIEENGYFYEQYDVINTGYWAWKKLAELLPYDYEFE
ncbi:MAG: carboxypeptidase-like regulatory domain-containing protein [Chitinophagaceae bacterium]|nr:carboxypeptidase-like regulatory domain-containing protein [Chitinophagaceae bacterium]